MQEVNYETLKQKIEKYYQNKLLFETIFTDLETTQSTFQELIHLNENEELLSLKLLNSNNINTIFYDVVNQNTKRKTKHIAMYEEINNEKFLLFKMDYYQSNSKMHDYHEISYCTYREHSNKILDKIQFYTLNNNELKDIRIIIFNTMRNREYNRKEYHLFSQDDNIVSVQMENKMYIEGEDGFNNRVKPIIRNVSQTLSKISIKLENILEDDVKIYKIKRK